MQRKKQSQIHDNDYPSSEASDFEGFHERVVGRDFSSDEEDVQVDQEVLGIHSSDSDQDSQDDESDENSLVSEEELLENFMKFNKNATGKKRESDNDDDGSEGENVDENGGWGNKRSAYYHDSASEYDSENERLEEQEARKLQRNQLEEMAASGTGATFADADDFESLIAKGQNRSSTNTVENDDEKDDLFMDETERVATNLDALSSKQKMKLLKSRMPEIVEYCKQYERVSAFLESLQNDDSEEEDEEEKVLSPLYKNASVISHLLLCHIAFYFALVLEENSETGNGVDAATAARLRKSHPVHEKISVLERMFEEAVGLLLGALEEEEEEVELDGTSLIDQDDVSESEQEDYEEFTTPEDDEQVAFESDDSDGQTMEDEHDEDKENEEPMIPVEEYRPIKGSKSSSKKKGGVIDAFGESCPMSLADQQDKIHAKKSLRFHVSQVDQELGKRSGGVSSANAGGDADLPYKKKNSKIPEEIEPESANKEEEEDYEEGLEKSMADIYGEISDHSSEEEGQEDANVEFDEEDEDSLYYNTIKAQKQSKKNAREELYAQIHAPLQDSASLVRPDEQDLPLDTKRKATYHILKNRGLTPYRKKEIKNPRVKRRLKYEGALKKLSSVRRVAVDKSKVSTHKYAGEKTGIKSNLSRSTKF